MINECASRLSNYYVFVYVITTTVAFFLPKLLFRFLYTFFRVASSASSFLIHLKRKRTHTSYTYTSYTHSLVVIRKVRKMRCVIYGGIGFVTQCCIKIANNHLCQFFVAYPLVIIIINDSFGVRSIYWNRSGSVRLLSIDRVDRIIMQ